MTESYFPELENASPVNSSKWGILNVHLAKCNQVITGYQWKYSYFDGFKMKIISSYDLIKLRHKIESKGLPWLITDINFANDAYKLNKKLCAKHKELKAQSTCTRSTSGVRFVYKCGDTRAKRGFYWTYVVPSDIDVKQKTFCNNKLENLKVRVEAEGLEWNIINQKVYDKVIAEEAEL